MDRAMVIVVFSLWLAAVPNAIAEPTPAPAPWEQGVKPAQRTAALNLFREGNRLYTESEYAQAADRYRRALREWDHPRIHGNLASALIRLNKLVDAMGHIESALAFGARPFDPTVYEHLETNKFLLAGQLSVIRVVCNTPGARVTLDGVVVLSGKGTKEIRVRAGKHEVVAKRAGFLTVSRSVSVSGGKREETKFVLVPLSQASLRERRWAAWKPWAVIGAGAAVALAGIPMGMASTSARDRFDDAYLAACPQGCTPDQVPAAASRHEDRARLWNRLEVSAYVVGGATLAVGAVLAYLNRERVIKLTESGARVVASPVVTPDHVGFALELGF